MPRVSVVIPAYNAERTLGEAIESVLGQTFSDVEVFVVDDGSSDGSEAVASAYGAPVACIRTENRGVSKARNLGLERATSEFVAFLDADDSWESKKLERQISLLETHSESGISTTGSLRVDDVGRHLGEVPACQARDPCEALLLQSMILGQISSPLLRRSLALDVGGFDPRFSQCADWDYFIRLSLRTEFAVIPEPLVRYRVAPGNMSTDIGLLERDTFGVLEKFFNADPPARYVGLKRRCYSNQWMILSGSYLHGGRRRDALRCLVNGIRADPANVRPPLGLPARWIRRLGGLPHAS